MVVTDLLRMTAGDSSPESLKKRKFFNVMADDVETVTTFLVERMLSAHEPSPRIIWLTKSRMLGKILRAPFRKRDFFEGFSRFSPVRKVRTPRGSKAMRRKRPFLQFREPVFALGRVADQVEVNRTEGESDCFRADECRNGARLAADPLRNDRFDRIAPAGVFRSLCRPIQAEHRHYG